MLQDISKLQIKIHMQNYIHSHIWTQSDSSKEMKAVGK